MIRSRLLCASAALLTTLLTSLAAAGLQAAPQVKLADGTPIKLSLNEDLSSATAQMGDIVHLEVAEEIRVDNVAVIPSGSLAGGHVVVAEHKKRLGRGGKVDFSVDYVKLPDGSNLKVRATAGREGKDKTGKVIVGTVLVSPLFMLMHGKDVDIAKGTTFTAYVDGDHPMAVASPSSVPQPQTGSMAATDAVLASNVQAGAGSQAGNQQQLQASADPATVVVKSSPDGAEISVDGSYMGSTPSTLRLQPGRHAVSLGKDGFKAWQRSINVNADETVTVDASLEKGM